MAHVNIYENLQEAQVRLLKTTVMYDGHPAYIRAICNHHKDGVFRVYYDKKLSGANRVSSTHPMYQIHNMIMSTPSDSPVLGPALDKLMEATKDCELIRKKINSPKFNRFRPFLLGMVNTGEKAQGKCFYLERTPQRHREQGLTPSMIIENRVSLSPDGPQRESGGLNYLSMWEGYFEDMLLGKYPSAQECLDALLDPDVTNEALAFDRKFALIRGPIGMMFLAYKDEVVGVLPNSDFSTVRLGRKFRHTKEAIEELNLFKSVVNQ